MRSPNRILVLSAIVLWLTPLAYGASVTGTVKGPDGLPFMGAFVQAQNVKNRILYSVLSNKEGRYRLENLPAGEYEVKIRAIGFKAVPRNNVNLSSDGSASFNFALEKAPVLWKELTLYQGKQLLPAGKGRAIIFQNCFICHGFQTRMAAVRLDEQGWQDAIDYMRTTMAFALSRRINDEQAAEIVSYLNSVFGTKSKTPPPTALPGYKATPRPFSPDAMNIAYVEYDVSGSTGLPWSAAPDKDGNLWIPFYGRGNEVARLNPNTGALKRFHLPFAETAGVHSAFPAPNGKVWFTEFALNKLAELDPSTGKITEYPDSVRVNGHRGGKHTVRADAFGNVWATGSPFSRFDPETGKYIDFMQVPSSYGIAFDKQHNPWFAVLRKDGKIGTVNAKTNVVSQWSPPTQGTPQRIQVDSNGIVWFGERTGNKLGRFDPKTQTFKEYPLPGPDASPYALAIKDGYIWYASTDQDLIGRLNPKSGKVVEYPFPQSEAMMREFFVDAEGRIWFAAPTSNLVGYFYFPKNSLKRNRMRNPKISAFPVQVPRKPRKSNLARQ